MTGERQILHTSSKKAKKTIQGTTVWTPHVSFWGNHEILLKPTAGPMKDKVVTGNSQHGFANRKAWPTWLLSPRLQIQSFHRRKHWMLFTLTLIRLSVGTTVYWLMDHELLEGLWQIKYFRGLIWGQQRWCLGCIHRGTDRRLGGKKDYPSSVRNLWDLV